MKEIKPSGRLKAGSSKQFFKWVFRHQKNVQNVPMNQEAIGNLGQLESLDPSSLSCAIKLLTVRDCVFSAVDRFGLFPPQDWHLVKAPLTIQCYFLRDRMRVSSGTLLIAVVGIRWLICLDLSFFGFCFIIADSATDCIGCFLPLNGWTPPVSLWGKPD